MAADLVNAATSDKLTEIDWTKNIEICELVVRDNRQAKDVIKSIKKRLGSKNSNTQLFAVSLLEMLMNNIGDPVHKQVIDTGTISVLVKIVKKKSDLPVQEKIFLLLDAAQTSLGGASGRFPQYYSAYYDLVSAGVQFPQRAVQPLSNEIQRSSPDNELAPPHIKGNATEAEPVKVPESSILQKAGTTMEVLREVLDAVDTRHPEAAKDEFTLDLVEQCSYQKQRVTQLAMTSRDDKIVSQAIELNEHLERVLARHDALISSRPTSASNLLNHEQEEDEEEAEQLFRRLRKGKARAGPEDENGPVDRPLRLLGSNVPSEMLHRPLIRPLTVGPKQEQIDNRPVPVEPKQEQRVYRPVPVEPKQEQFVYRPAPEEPKQEQGLNKLVPMEAKQEQNVNRLVVTLPPPPAKHAERERFFQENKSDGSALSGRMKGLSLHSRNASSSRSGSVDFSDEAFS